MEEHGEHPILRTFQEPVESIQLRIIRQTDIGTVVVGICYRGPDQEEDEDFLKQLEEASRSEVLVYMQDFRHPHICSKDNTTQHEQSRTFLKCIENYFLAQVIKKPTMKTGPYTYKQGKTVCGLESCEQPLL